MKKIAFGAFGLLLLAASCKKPLLPNENPTDVEEVQAIFERRCAADEVLQAQLLADPSLRDRMNQIETFTQKAIRNGAVQRLVNGVIEIPVVIHVLYNTTAQNISDAQVQSQLKVLNDDFQNLNADGANLPSFFSGIRSSGMNVRFVLATGLAANPIRVKTKVKSWSTNDAMKYSKRGGSNVVNPDQYLNIWVCNLGNGLLGYAQFPGSNPATDGVVVLYSAFGSRAIAPGGTYVSKYDLGRTTTHEVGHYLNLRHIWGDDNGACSGSDQVTDTPNQGGANYGCPQYPKISCNNGASNNTEGGDLFMNYMDYTDDACMYMFTNGQANRSMSLFLSGGARAAMGQ